MREVQIVRNSDKLAQCAADVVARAMRAAVAADGVFRVALAGGSTPRAVHAALADTARYHALPWSLTEVFWGDERTVPPDHADSNYRMAVDTLLAKVPVDPARVFRIEGEDANPPRAAERYERTLRTAFGVEAPAVPRFDLVLLGIGPDGHTASLFPGSPALDERRRLVVATWASAMKTWRITLTLPVLNAAAEVAFVVGGEAKAAAVAAALEPPADAVPPPAALVQPADGRLTWVLDAPAARYLQSTSQ